MSPQNTPRSAVVWASDGIPFPSADYSTRLVEDLTRLSYEATRADLTTATPDDVLPGYLHVLTGGSTSVGDVTGWMPSGLATVERLIGSARDGDSYLLGVCLGSQMIAHCLAPGSVIAGDQMWAGLTGVTWRGGEGPAVLPSFHYEQIAPAALEAAGARIEAWSDAVPVVAYTAGSRVAGIQLHPEFRAADMEVLVPFNRAVIERNGGVLDEVAARSASLSPNWGSDGGLAAIMRRLLPDLGVE